MANILFNNCFYHGNSLFLIWKQAVSHTETNRKQYCYDCNDLHYLSENIFLGILFFNF